MMYTLYLISVWLHIVAAITWIGGMLFLALILGPYARQAEQRDTAISLIRWTGERFRAIGWACILALLLTGVFSVLYRGFSLGDLSSDVFWKGEFGHILGMKLSVVAIILLISVLHDFVIGPRAGAVAQANPGSPDATRLRRQAAWLGRFNLLLALIVVALAMMLVRGGP